MTTPALILAKQQLRTLVRESLKNVTEESNIIQSKTLLETLKTFPPYLSAASISIFLSMPTGEIQTAAIVRDALSRGKAVYIPYLHARPPHLTAVPKRVMDMVRLHDIADYEALTPDKWGIPSVDAMTVGERERVLGETSEEVDLATLDLVLVPGLAFDGSPGGGVKRMGHGRGFYDLFFERYAALSSKLPLALYGLGLKEQYLQNQVEKLELPVGPQDKLLDGVILGDGSIIR